MNPDIDKIITGYRKLRYSYLVGLVVAIVFLIGIASYVNWLTDYVANPFFILIFLFGSISSVFAFCQNRIVNTVTAKIMKVLALDMGYHGFNVDSDALSELKEAFYFKDWSVKSSNNQIKGTIAGLMYETSFVYVTDGDSENEKTMFNGVVIVSNAKSATSFNIIPKRAERWAIATAFSGDRHPPSHSEFSYCGKDYEVIGQENLDYQRYFEIFEKSVPNQLKLVFVERTPKQCIAGFATSERLFKIGGLTTKRSELTVEIERALSNLAIPAKIAAGMIAADAAITSPDDPVRPEVSGEVRSAE